MLKTELTLSIILGHLIVTKYASQNSTKGHLNLLQYMNERMKLALF